MQSRFLRALDNVCSIYISELISWPIASADTPQVAQVLLSECPHEYRALLICDISKNMWMLPHCQSSPGCCEACLDLAWEWLPSHCPQLSGHTHGMSSLVMWGLRLKGVWAVLGTPWEKFPMRGNGSNHHHQLLEFHRLRFCTWCLLFPSFLWALFNFLVASWCWKNAMPCHSYMAWCLLYRCFSLCCIGVNRDLLLCSGARVEKEM